MTDNRRLRDETFAYLKPLADESANNRVELAKLQAELKCCCEKQELREQIVLGKVNELALTTQAKFGCIDGTIANMMGTLGKITDAEIATIKLFANASAQEVPSGSISNLLDEHNSI